MCKLQYEKLTILKTYQKRVNLQLLTFDNFLHNDEPGQPKYINFMLLNNKLYVYVKLYKAKVHNYNVILTTFLCHFTLQVSEHRTLTHSSLEASI